MALPATAVWEIMADGLATNGGFFVTGATGVDYSQSASAHASVTDLVIGNPDNTTITSASEHPFDADCVGNGLYISAGTGFTPGWYQIVSVVGVIATLDRACGTAGSTGGSGKIGGAVTFVDAVFEAAVAGNKYWVRSGTHTLGANIYVAADGTSAADIRLEGYNAIRGDKPTRTNRPLIAAGTYQLQFDTASFWTILYLRVTTSHANGFTLSGTSRVIGCRADQSSALANKPGFSFWTFGGILIDCEATSTNGYAIYTNRTTVIGCYFHDSVCGVVQSTTGNNIYINCIFDSCSIAGVDCSTLSTNNWNNCTFYNCGTGILMRSTLNEFVVNSIFDTCTIGISANVVSTGNIIVVNCNFHGNGTDLINIVASLVGFALDPQFINGLAGNFAIDDNMKAKGVPMSFGRTTLNFIDLGAAQKIAEGKSWGIV